jgi:hypothetical protein
MAGLVPAIHVFGWSKEDMDARDKPGHDELGVAGATVKAFISSNCAAIDVIG